MHETEDRKKWEDELEQEIREEGEGRRKRIRAGDEEEEEECDEVDDIDGLWVDFNLSENAITWYCNKYSFSDKSTEAEAINESNDRVWNLITLFVSDVESVQIHRPVNSEDVLIYFKFKEPCISSFDDNQAIVGAANNLKLVVSYKSKKIATLLSKVLPFLFKNKFFHNSTKVSSSKKSVYKPLNVTVSRKTKSDSSKTKSDASSFVNFFDPICGKSNKSDQNSTLKDETSLGKVYSMSPVSTKCEVISIPDSFTPSTEMSLDFLPIKDQLIRTQTNIVGENSSEYETAEIYPNAIEPKVSTNIQSMGMINNKAVDIKVSSNAKIDVSTHSSFDEDFLSVQEDIDRIQILSRRCSGSNVRHSQLSNNSRPTSSTSKNILKFSMQDSSTPNFQTANQSEQHSNKTIKISKPIDVVKESEICGEKVIQESSTQNFETANESEISNMAVKISKSKDVLLQKKEFKQNVLNIKISKPKNILKTVSVTLTDVPKNGDYAMDHRATITEKLCNEYDFYNPTQEIVGSQKSVVIGKENVSVENLNKIKDLVIIVEKFDSKVNQDGVMIDNKENVLTCDIINDADILCEKFQKILSPTKISKPIYSGTKIQSKHTKKRKKLITGKRSAKTDTSDLINIMKENTSEKTKLVVGCTEQIDSKNNSILTKSTAMNFGLNSTKKWKMVCNIKTRLYRSNELIDKELDKENLDIVCSQREKDYLDEETTKVEKLIRESELQKNVKLISLNKVPSYKMEELVKNNESDQKSIIKKLLVEDIGTGQEIINAKELVFSKETILEAAIDTISKKENCGISSPDIFDEKIYKTQVLIQHNRVDQEKKLKETQINNKGIKAFTNENVSKEAQVALTHIDDFSSEDEITLKQLAEKLKSEKFEIQHYTRLERRKSSEGATNENLILQHASEEIKSYIIENCENAFDDLKKRTVTEHVDIGKGNLKSPVAHFQDEVISSYEKANCLVEENPQKPQNYKEIIESNLKSNDILEMCKRVEDLSEISIETVYEICNRGNNKKKKKSNNKTRASKNKLDCLYESSHIFNTNKNQELSENICENIEIKTRKNVQIIEETCNKSTDMNKSNVIRDFNDTISTTIGAKRKRKLYNPEDLTYLENPTLLKDVSTKLVEIKSPIEPDYETVELNKVKIAEKKNYIGSEVISLDKFDIKTKRYRKDLKESRASKKLNTSKKLKIVNPNTTLKVGNNSKSKRYSQLRPVFHNMLESFRKEIGKSFIEILEENTPKKEKKNKNKYTNSINKTTKRTNKNKLSKTDMIMRTPKPSFSLSPSSSLSIKLKNKTFVNGTLDTPPLLSIENSPRPELRVEKNNHEKKINIISDIQIRPKRMLFEDKTVVPKKKIKIAKFTSKSILPQEPTELSKEVDYEVRVPIKPTDEMQLPIISESITHEEISSWIATGSPKYSQCSEIHHVLKHSYPMFKSLLKSQEVSQEYSDVVKICNILKKYV